MAGDAAEKGRGSRHGRFPLKMIEPRGGGEAKSWSTSGAGDLQSIIQRREMVVLDELRQRRARVLLLFVDNQGIAKTPQAQVILHEWR